MKMNGKKGGKKGRQQKGQQRKEEQRGIVYGFRGYRRAFWLILALT